MNEYRISARAMATQWECVLYGERYEFLRSVGEEAIAEIKRLEQQLSLFEPTSETADVNRGAGEHPVVVDPRFYRLVEECVLLSKITNGAFDITISPLMQVWKLQGGTGTLPSSGEIDEALKKIGSARISLCQEHTSIQFGTPEMSIDFGAVGKGYAAEVAGELIVDYGISSCLLHGGTSTVVAIGSPPDQSSWQIAVNIPVSGEEAPIAPHRFHISDRALSVSAPHGKWFEADGKMYGHIIDPRTGWPVQSASLAAVVTESATESDALSTALLTLGPAWLSTLAELRPKAQALIVWRDSENATQVSTLGMS